MGFGLGVALGIVVKALLVSLNFFGCLTNFESLI